ncbi:cytochrome c-type biogenesis protein [Shimia ponticola]|uniref:cytochrome c-type biogenesis protein n=1 Tax=Shimia ponticola TaxID=2582893 RepID=UPI00164A5F10|nr:cytochrome c-type biogenesis protein [Shimia ponticola]
MKRLILVLCLAAAPTLAVEPDEVLSDPMLEDRAREISAGLRCPVCQNESIDESNADVAKDLRLLVRERLVAGDSNEETVDFIVARYGEYVLLRPDTGGANLILWGVGPAVLLLVLGGLFLARRRGRSDATAPLSAEEEARLAELLKDDPA